MVRWDSAAWLEYKKGCVGHNGAHQSRILIWNNNLAIYRAGGYTAESGKEVFLDNRVLLNGTLVFDSPFTLPELPEVPGGTSTGVCNIDCIDLGYEAV